MASRQQQLRRRAFELRPGDERFAHTARGVRKVRFDLPDAQTGTMRTIQRTLKRTLDVSYAPATKEVHNPHTAYWHDFCKVAQILCALVSRLASLWQTNRPLRQNLTYSARFWPS